MYSNLYLLTQAQGVLLVGVLALSTGWPPGWLGFVAFSMLVGFGLYVLNVNSGADSTESLADLLSETIPGVRVWLLFLVVLWVTFMAGLFLSSETW